MPRSDTLLAILSLLALAPGLAMAAAVPPAAAVSGALPNPAESIAYPVCSGVVDISKPPYGAKGDGITDCTAVFQQAMSDIMGQGKILYIPNGTYVISATLKWSKKNSAGEDAWGLNFIQGQSRDKTILKLKDGVFTDASKPQSIMWCGGFGSADWFSNYVENMTFDTGTNNPGAIGLQFYSNNIGAVRWLNIVSGDGKGVVGLDLGQVNMNGPLLAKDITVKGFATGIRTGNRVNSMTFERLTLKGQTKAGIENGEQCISIRNLLYEGAGPAVTGNGLIAVLDAKLTGTGAAAQVPAIDYKHWKRGGLFVRNIATSGFKTAVASTGSAENLGPVAAPTGANVAEWCSNKPTSPFPSGTRSLNLKVEETPDVPWDDPATWAVVQGTDAPAIQKAIDSGATTVFIPAACNPTSTVIVRGKVRRIVGVGSAIDYNKKGGVNFQVLDGDSPLLVFEHFFPINHISVETKRTVVFRSCEVRILSTKGGPVFFEDVATHNLTFTKGQQVWARQLNVENQGTKIVNDGGNLWILGYKTERGGTLLDARNGSKNEIFGNFCYDTTPSGDAPMFRNDGSSVFAFMDEVCFGSDYYRTIISEVRRGQTKDVPVNTGYPYPYIGTAK